MENDYNRDNFEEFLQDQLRNQKMFPNDEVWRKINNQLHGEKRWPALTFAALLLIGFTVSICWYFSAKQNIFSIKPQLQLVQSSKSIEQPAQLANNNIDISQQFSQKNQAFDFNPQTKENINIQPEETVLTKTVVAISENEGGDEDFAKQLSQNENSKISVEQKYFIESAKANETLALLENTSKNEASNIINEVSVAENYNKQVSSEQETPGTITNKTEKEITEKSSSIKLSIKNEEKALSLIEKFKASRKSEKFGILFYMAPSISYRKLSEDNSIMKNVTNGPASLNQVTDVNDVVRHKSSAGIEAGLSVLYDIAKTVKLKGGLQFNVRQYTIDAYRSNTEISSIALNEGNWIDTINTLVYYRNYNGNSSTVLRNRYYQISIPIGLQWQVAGNKKFQFNIGAGIQPTLLLNRNAYLLTTNFKNYTEKGEMVRKWNLNTNFEAFVTMNTGSVTWQLGPQIRYQPNSTYIKQYPIKEHLIDYGIKFGVSTMLK